MFLTGWWYHLNRPYISFTRSLRGPFPWVAQKLHLHYTVRRAYSGIASDLVRVWRKHFLACLQGQFWLASNHFLGRWWKTILILIGHQGLYQFLVWVSCLWGLDHLINCSQYRIWLTHLLSNQHNWGAPWAIWGFYDTFLQHVIYFIFNFSCILAKGSFTWGLFYRRGMAGVYFMLN